MTPSEIESGLKGLGVAARILGAAELAGRDPGEHPENFAAGVVAEPETAGAASAIIAWAAGNGVAIVPQGGRTGLVGGSMSRPGELVLSTARLDRIEAIDPAERTAIVGTGVRLETLQAAAAAHGLSPGIDLAARGSATIGGMVSTNAGGILAFRNGVMRHQVLGLEVVLPDGSVLNDLTRVVKVSAGPDLKQVFIGAEGALGFVTRAVIRLEEIRPHRATALVGVDDAAAALALAGRLAGLSGARLEGAELMWADFFADSCRHHGFDPSFIEPGTAAVLLTELSADSDEAAADQLESMLESQWESLNLRGALVSRSIAQGRTFWALREQSWFIYDNHPGAPSFDISVPPSALDAYVEGMRDRLARLDPALGCYVYGHIADGNLHLSVTRAVAVDTDRMRAIEAAIYEGIRQAGGSFSAEHGVGSDKKEAYLSFGDPVKAALARQIKAALDPAGLFNPGKVPF